MSTVKAPETPTASDPTKKPADDAMDDSDIIDSEIFTMGTDDIVQRSRALENEVRILRSEALRINHEVQTMKDKIKENTEKVKINKVLPYLVSNIVEILDVEPDPYNEDD